MCIGRRVATPPPRTPHSGKRFILKCGRHTYDHIMRPGRTSLQLVWTRRIYLSIFCFFCCGGRGLSIYLPMYLSVYLYINLSPSFLISALLLLSLGNNSPATCEGGAPLDHGTRLGVGRVVSECDSGFGFLLVPRA